MVDRLCSLQKLPNAQLLAHYQPPHSCRKGIQSNKTGLISEHGPSIANTDREDVRVKPTDVHNPNYYHKVVDCQWACPAHTNVPEYIRLIAQGRYTDAYMLNRESNVFPAILGRTCDRPCEPACRRGRLDGKPIAICRLKRVAADLKGDISHRLPPAPEKMNG